MQLLKSNLGGNITIDPALLHEIISVCHEPPKQSPRGLNWGKPIDLNLDNPSMNKFWAYDYKKVANIISDISKELIRIRHSDSRLAISTPKGDWTTTKAYPAAYAVALMSVLIKH
jgi:hypothetical protein